MYNETVYCATTMTLPTRKSGEVAVCDAGALALMPSPINKPLTRWQLVGCRGHEEQRSYRATFSRPIGTRVAQVAELIGGQSRRSRLRA
jgi:hypothetical protein